MDELGRSNVVRVAFIDHTAKLGGGELALRRLIRQIDRRRCEPMVVLLQDGLLAERLREDGVAVHLLPADPGLVNLRKGGLWRGVIQRPALAMSVAATTRRLTALLRQLRPDVVHTNSLKADVIGGMAARLAGIPSVWHVRDRISPDYLPKPTVWGFRLASRVLPDYVIANSQATLSTLPGSVRRRAETVWPEVSGEVNLPKAVIPSGVDRSSDGGVGDEAREKLLPVVTLVGRLAPWKGQDVLLRAAPEVLAAHPEARFRIVGSALFGEDEYAESLGPLARRLGIADRVSFEPFTDDVGEVYATSGVVVHASTLPEPWGQVVLEAMAAGLPVVATRAGGVLERIREGETGRLVAPGDAGAMARAVIGLLDDPRAALEMGARAREHVRRRYDVRVAADLLLKFYANILGSTRERPVLAAEDGLAPASGV